MIELSKERIAQILHDETFKTEDLKTILRAIYNRYMHLYEDYFADIDALNDEKVAELRKYHEETKSLIKYYYMDIPLDVCLGIYDFEGKYSTKLLGTEWHDFLFGSYKEFTDKIENWGKSEDALKAEYKELIMDGFYDAMGDVFRDGFGTGGATAEKVMNGLKDLMSGK